MTVGYAEPLLYDFASTVGRFSSYFYQCYLIPAALAVFVLSLGGKEKVRPRSMILRIVLMCLVSAAIYLLIAPQFSGFSQLGSVSHLFLLFLLCLYSLFFSPMQPHIRLIVTAAVIAEINWAQSISTQVLMPVFSIGLSNTIQFFLLFVALLVIVCFRPPRSEKIPTAYWLIMLIIALISVISLSYIRIYGGQRNSMPTANPIVSILLISFFIINLLIYYMYYILLREHRRASEMTTMQAKLTQDLEFYKRSDILCREYQSLRHELKNHIAVMDNLLKNGEYEKLQDYFSSYAGERLPQLEVFSCANPLISSVITHQTSTAKAAGVTLDVIAAVPEEIGIEDDDICSLLANLLDNSVEGCLRSGGNLVKATLHTDKGCLFISVSNPVPPNTLEGNPELLTTKENPKAHGFGIPIIRKIAEKYDGFVSFSEKNGIFSADAMLYMKEAEA